MTDYRAHIEADRANDFNVHDHMKSRTVPELQVAQQAESYPFEVCLLSVTGDLNCGSIIRSACLHGAQRATVFGRRRFDNRSLVGCQNYIPIDKVPGLEADGVSLSFEAFEEWLRVGWRWPFFCEQGGTELPEFEWQSRLWRCAQAQGPETAGQGAMPVLVFGAEGTGVPSRFMRGWEDTVVSIPQRGVLRSFNVSAAAAMCMWDMRRAMGWF